MRDELTVVRLNAFAEELEAQSAAPDTAPQTFTHEEVAAVRSAEDDRD
jgi:hypothetical protein